ncbi:Glutathione S-transferase GST-6.0 [Achromobacter veterisilvae]|uniref:Glutathione S-transferase GST-6.0 n=2 Tax=Achromobacter TaxID=222 RepID=A0A446CVQ6_9BURK|nr:glutathione S-transferase [Achromobacter veterisilvae]SSW71932.1 Glutathione S-transferase GST-6.0 [Achromobacter veterisilvae]
MKPYELIGSAGCGSAIVEMALVLANVPHTLTDVPYLKPGPERDRLLRLNPLGQVPTLVLPDGEVMTESAAMILHLNDVAPQAGLAPPADKPERARFLNLLIRLVGAIYPTFTYGDDPPQWTTAGAPADLLRERVHTRRAELWQELERQAGAPHMLGRRFSALDLYITVMTHWRPGPAWFEAACPALSAVAREAAQEPNVARVLRRNFPPPTE